VRSAELLGEHLSVSAAPSGILTRLLAALSYNLPRAYSRCTG
jgi:hypothetical protein